MENQQQIPSGHLKWEWTKTDSMFVTQSGNKEMRFSLKPTVSIEIKEQSEILKRLEVNVEIDTERLPSYSQAQGWCWHKSRIFPPIMLKISARDPETNTTYSSLPNLKANIFAAKIVFQKSGNQQFFHYQDVGLFGETQSPVHEGVAIFDGIKFQTTSFINENVNFYLLIVLSIPDKNQNKKFDQIVTSMISSPLFIDSRRSAKLYQQKKIFSFIQQFNPNLLNQHIQKSIINEQKRIVNSIVGLHHYLVATNIRYKIKHPIYLAIRFSNCLQVLAHKLVIQKLSPTGILKQMQSVLQNEICLKKRDQKQRMRQQIEQNQYKFKPKEPEIKFVIKIFGNCSKSMREKIYSLLEPLNCGSIVFNRNNSLKYQQFVSLNQLGELYQIYEQFYHNNRPQADQQNNQVIPHKDQFIKAENRQTNYKRQQQHQLLQIQEVKNTNKQFNCLAYTAYQPDCFDYDQIPQYSYMLWGLREQLRSNLLNQLQKQTQIINGLLKINTQMKRGLQSMCNSESTYYCTAVANNQSVMGQPGYHNPETLMPVFVTLQQRQEMQTSKDNQQYMQEGM